jgi:hypothetical protein
MWDGRDGGCLQKWGLIVGCKGHGLGKVFPPTRGEGSGKMQGQGESGRRMHKRGRESGEVR